MSLLDKIIGEWQRPWVVLWFCSGALALGAGFWLTTERSGLDVFMLAVALVGLVCVLALAFRRNTAGNGLGLVANVGEMIAQGRSGATGLMLAPMFYFATHLYGFFEWRKSEDAEGNMTPRKAGLMVWIVSASFIVLGLAVFPWLNAQLQQFSFIPDGDEAAISLMSLEISWYQINVLAFVLGVTAQTTMILRYAISWSLWIVVNFVWMAVNLANNNTIFAIQTMIYQVNAIVGLYAWWRSTRVSTTYKE